MDLNDIRINHTNNSNGFMGNDDPVNPMKRFDIRNMGQFNTENQFSSEIENNNFYYQQENFLYFYINNKKSYDENEILVQKTYEEPHFLPLLETRREEEGRIILVHEKPYLSLTNFLQNNKIDNSLRFLLFKQGLHIIFKLISLDQDFSFFNYTIFFVEDYRDENDIDCLFYDFESTLRLKIYYHVEIRKYEKQHQLTSKYPFHWIFYLFCLIFKEFSIDYDKDEEKTNLMCNYDQFTISIMKTIFSFLCERFTDDSYNQDCFEEFLNLLNPILKYHGIQEIYQYDSNKEYFSYIDFRFDIDNFSYTETLDFLTLPISLNKAVKLKRNINYNPQAFKNSSENNDNIYLDNYKNIFKPENIFPWSDNSSQYLKNIYMHLSEKSNYDKSQYKSKLEDFSPNKLYNQRNIIYDPIKNNNIDSLSQPIQNDFFHFSKNIRKNLNYNQNCRKNNVFNINNYFQITNPRTNINVNGNLYNHNFNVNKHSKLNTYPNNYPFNIFLNHRYPNENTFYNDNCIDQKLREYESLNSLYFPYYKFYNSSNNINLDHWYGLKKDFMYSSNQGRHYYSNNYQYDNNNIWRNNQPPTDENNFLGNKRRSSDIGYSNSYCHNNGSQNPNMNIFDRDDRLTRHALNESINNDLNLNENLNYKNNINRNSNMIFNSAFESNNGCVNKSEEDFGINISKNKDFPAFISDSNEILYDQNEKNKKDQIYSVSSKKNRSFEIKKVEKISKKENKKQNKSKNIINIFNIENVPKSKKSNSLISMKFFNDKSIINNQGSIDHINESSQIFYARNDFTFKQTDDTKKETPFDIKSQKNNLQSGSGEICYSIEKKISEIDEKKDNINSSTKLKEYSDFISNIFNDHNKENKGNYKERLFPVNGLFSCFYNNPLNSNDVVSVEINKNNNENSNKNGEKDEDNQSKINEKIRIPSTNNNIIFNITKKICMNNIRSRLGNTINFKRRKLSIENIRKKSKNKIKDLSKTIKDNILDAETFQKEEKFQKALINMNEQKIILNKNILKNFFSQEEYYESQGDIFTTKVFPKINDEATPLEGKINLKINRISQKYKMKSYKIKELKKALTNKCKNERQANDKPNITNQNNSNEKFNSHVENPRKKYHQLNKISRNLFKYNINVKGSFNKNFKNNKKEITNSISSSRRISRNSTNYTDNIKNSKKISKNKLKNESNINCNLHFFEYLNDKKFSRNKIEINKNKKSQKLIGEKIDLVRSEIDYHDKNYQKDLELKLLDKRHVFMKNNFPTLYVKENFYYIKKNDLNEILENHSKIPEMFDLKTIESYIRDIKDSILNVKNEKSDKFIWDSIITNHTLNKKNINIEKNKNYTEDISNQINKPLANNLQEDILNLNSNQIIDGNKNLSTEDNMKHQNKLEELTPQIEIERKKNDKLEFENPLALNRLWSPYVLNNDQILLYYFEEARKIWPRYLNWSEEIALNLLNKFDYKIENILDILRDPAKEILSYVKANLSNRLSLKSGWKNRSRPSVDKKN